MFHHVHQTQQPTPLTIGSIWYEYCSVAKSCPAPCDPMNCSTPGFPVLHYLLEFAQTHIHWIGDAIQHLILWRPLLLLPSIFPSIRVFSNESALHIRWPKYWSFNISPSNKYSELISFRIDSFDLLAVQGTLKILLQRCFPQFESVNSLALSLYIGLRISFLKWFSNILID